jgi:hypothetical protein
MVVSSFKKGRYKLSCLGAYPENALYLSFYKLES